MNQWTKEHKKKYKMDGAGANMCKAVNIDGVAVKASFISRVCVGGKNNWLKIK